MVVSIVIVGVLIHCALLYTICDLKVIQMNIQFGLIQKLIFYEFELGYNAVEATENVV